MASFGLRNFKTINEKKLYYITVEQREFATIAVRSKRRPKVLPQAYDDIPFDVSRTWKRHRKTQWKTTKQ